MGLTKRNKCRHCGELFIPDYRNRNRQKYCKKPECRKESKKASQKKWLSKPENKDYFKGPENVKRVQAWRKDNPEYWKQRCPAQSALQDPLKAQPSENTSDKAKNANHALQDLLKRQPPVIIGLIANFIGSALQDDIARTLLRMQQSGQDILYCQHTEKGGNHDCQITHIAREDP